MKKKILYIEDDDMNRLLVKKVLEAQDYQILEAVDGLSGITLAQAEPPDLILIDTSLPGLDGYETATRIKSIGQLAEIPVVAVTANVMEGERQRCLAAGCEGYIRKPIDVDLLPEQIQKYLKGLKEALGQKSELGVYKRYSQELVSKLQNHVVQLEQQNRMLVEQSKEMHEAYLGVMSAFIRTVEEKHSYTAGHAARVRAYSLRIGEKLGLNEDQLNELSTGALLHDIGKVVMEESALGKEEKLDPSEWKRMREHPEIGARIIRPLKFLGDVTEIVHQHHENWDGSGYPQGLRGDEIDFLASIVTVADCFDAMTTKRGYNEISSLDQVAEEIQRCRGTQFNPVAVDAMLEVIDDMKARRLAREIRALADLDAQEENGDVPEFVFDRKKKKIPGGSEGQRVDD